MQKYLIKGTKTVSPVGGKKRLIFLPGHLQGFLRGK